MRFFQDLQNVFIFAGAGEFSVWDFSGYEPYYMLYDYFLGDVNCIHVVLFNLEDSPEEQMAEVIFWLNFIKARIHPKMPLGQFFVHFRYTMFKIAVSRSISQYNKKMFKNRSTNKNKHIIFKIKKSKAKEKQKKTVRNNVVH